MKAPPRWKFDPDAAVIFLASPPMSDDEFRTRLAALDEVVAENLGPRDQRPLMFAEEWLATAAGYPAEATRIVMRRFMKWQTPSLKDFGAELEAVVFTPRQLVRRRDAEARVRAEIEPERRPRGVVRDPTGERV